MELYQITQFISFAECGTLSKAAEIVHTSQPALSRSMKALEDEIGVPLFVHTKNKLILSEFGEAALPYAKRIADDAKEFTAALRELHRKKSTFAYGSIAPAPIWELTPVLSQLYMGMTVSADLQKSDDMLIRGLDNGTYNLIVLLHALDEEKYYSQFFMHEKLSIMLPEKHPLAQCDSIYLKDLAGEKILIHSKIGFWYDICKQKIPDAVFLEQNELSSLHEIVKTAALPSFVTNVSRHMDFVLPSGKVIIPILDEEVDVNFWCVCKKERKKQYAAVFSSIKDMQL